ncbi:hypothetical protein FOA52_006820 [Chlamydomonas sp. UWO 241]|nr:hypothetical protein FOA52_006820 [Chlamydomonas sp. UWO 241]
MRLDVAKAGWIPDEIRQQMRTAEKNRMTAEGFLVVTSQKHRTQPKNMDGAPEKMQAIINNAPKNMDDALEKMQAIIDDAVTAITPTIADAATVKRVKAQIKAGKERRLDNKKQDSQKKNDRRRKDWD